MKMPGRKYEAGNGYRYGFNGQEKSDEVIKGNFTAEFWEYDSRIGRRWNLDPKPIKGLSGYSTFANNPIMNLDKLGDTLSIGINQESRNDIRSLVSKDNQGFINLPKPGRLDVTLNESIKIGDKTISLKDAMKKDRGLKLLHTMINDSKNYFYNVSLRRQAEVIDLTTGIKTQLDSDLNSDANFAVGNLITENTSVTSGGSGIAYYQTFENLSFTLRGDEKEKLNNLQIIPNKSMVIGFVSPSYKRKYDGVIRLAPGDFQQQITSGGNTQLHMIRSKIVFHELSENYWRVNGLSYEEAHNQAIVDYTGGALYANGKASDEQNVSSGAGISNNRRLGEQYSFIRK